MTFKLQIYELKNDAQELKADVTSLLTQNTALKQELGRSLCFLKA